MTAKKLPLEGAELPKLEVLRTPVKPRPPKFRARIEAPSGTKLESTLTTTEVRLLMEYGAGWVKLGDFDAFCEVVAATQSELHARAEVAE